MSKLKIGDMFIYARQHARDLNQYSECVAVAERDRDNEFRIEFIAENGDGYFLFIPKESFREFVIACQRLQAKRVFN